MSATRNVRIDAKRLKIAMTIRGIESDADLAEKSGVNERTIRNVKSGGTCSFEVWNKLADACNCNPIDLLLTTGYPDPNWAALAALSI